MRLTSALIGALTVLFAFLLARELAPGRPWLGVLAALLVAYQPMYGFISGAVNNDVGVNAGAAALELLLIRMLRRGVTWSPGAAHGRPAGRAADRQGHRALAVSGRGARAAGDLWRHHRRTDLRGWAALALAPRSPSGRCRGACRTCSARPAAAAASTGGTPVEAGTAASAVSEALAHPLDYLSYLWQSLLPRLSFMTAALPHHALPHVRDFRRTRLGCVRLVRRVLSALGLRA